MRTLNEMGSLLAARGLLAEEDRNQWKGDTHSVYWITYDSKRAVPGTLFFCKGKNFKREYLEEAIHRGCVGYVSEKEYIKKEGVPCLLTNDIRSGHGRAGGFVFWLFSGASFADGNYRNQGKDHCGLVSESHVRPVGKRKRRQRDRAALLGDEL